MIDSGFCDDDYLVHSIGTKIATPPSDDHSIGHNKDLKKMNAEGLVPNQDLRRPRRRTVISMDKDKGKSIAEVIEHRANNADHDAAIVWNEFAQWYKET